MARPRPWEKQTYIAANDSATEERAQSRTLTVAEAKEKFLQYKAQGHSNIDAMAKLGRQETTYRQWRLTDKEFARRVDKMEFRLGAPEIRAAVEDFGSWRQKYLNTTTYWHQWQWVDLLEGREPRDLHGRQTWVKGRTNRIMVNTPPNHGKSTTLTMDYSVYRICQDPNVRIIIVSQSKRMAEKMLNGIKLRLTNHQFRKLHEDFGPVGGFNVGAAQWTADKITVGTKDGVEKDPTVEAIGVGSQIYGARADLIILDDIVTLKSSWSKTAKEHLMDWIRSEVMSRLEPKTGRLIMIGTRLSVDDLYMELVREDTHKIWTYLTQPAILDEGDEVGPDEIPNYITLWPERFDANEIEAIKADHGADQARFRLVYQQESAQEDAIFPEKAVYGCTYQGNLGPLRPDVRPNGMHGLHIVAGLDPATAGFTAIVVLAIDKRNGHRYLLDAYNRKGMRPHQLRELMVEITRRYGINEWRIEKNGLQSMISQDRDIRLSLYGLGARIVEHITHAGNKWDPNFGIRSLVPLFLGALEEPKANLIHIPDQHTKVIRSLIEQLIVWTDDGVGRTDLVMALWFAEVGCREALRTAEDTHVPNRWLTDRGRQMQKVFTIDELTAEQQRQELVGNLRWG